MRKLVIAQMFLVIIFLSLLTLAISQEPPVIKTFESNKVFMNAALKRLEEEKNKYLLTSKGSFLQSKNKPNTFEGGKGFLGGEVIISNKDNLQNRPINSNIDNDTNIDNDYSLLIVKSMINQWEKNPSEINLIRATDQLNIMAASHSVKAHVTIITRPYGGAIIKYQTIGARYRNESPFTANGLTNECNAILPIGYYNIWSERDGKITSDKESKYEIVEKDMTVELYEKKK